MDFQVENRENAVNKLFEKTSSFQHLFFIIFLSIWAWFWRVLARFWGHFAVQKKTQKGEIHFFNSIVFFIGFGQGWGGFGEGLGRVWGRAIGFAGVSSVCRALLSFAELC